jgi:hypothetical protein
MKKNDLLEKMNSKVIFSKPSGSRVYFVEDLESINQEELENSGIYAVSDGMRLIDFKEDDCHYDISDMQGVESQAPRELASLEDFYEENDFYNSKITYDKMVKCFDLFVDRSKYDNAKVYLDVNGVTVKGENCCPGYRAILNGIEYEVVDRELLEERIISGADLTKLCTSLVTDMSKIFSYIHGNETVNQPIGNWNVSNGSDMMDMFFESEFNQSIKNWVINEMAKEQFMFNS